MLAVVFVVAAPTVAVVMNREEPRMPVIGVTGGGGDVIF